MFPKYTQPALLGGLRKLVAVGGKGGNLPPKSAVWEESHNYIIFN